MTSVKGFVSDVRVTRGLARYRSQPLWRQLLDKWWHRLYHWQVLAHPFIPLKTHGQTAYRQTDSNHWP